MCKINKLEHDLGFPLNGSHKMSKRTFTSSQMIPGTEADSVSNPKCARRGIYERSDSVVANNSPPAHWTRSSTQALEASTSFRDSQCGRKNSAAPHLRCAKICSEGGLQAGGGTGSSEKPRGETGAAAERANWGLPRKGTKSRGLAAARPPVGSPPPKRRPWATTL